MNCGLAHAEPPAVRFRYACPNQWETLTSTAWAGVRFCEECRSHVYFCDTADEAERHTRRGNGIAVTGQATASVAPELAQNFMGLPVIRELWSEKLFGR